MQALFVASCGSGCRLGVCQALSFLFEHLDSAACAALLAEEAFAVMVNMVVEHLSCCCLITHLVPCLHG